MGGVFICFSSMVSFYCKFTESFDVILVNCDDVYLDYRVFVVSQYLEELL